MIRWAVIPMKPLTDAKSRLSDILSEPQRQKLVMSLFTHTVIQLQESDRFDGIAVVTADPTLVQIGDELGIHIIHEDTPSDLNTSLTACLKVLKAHKVDGIMILPGDLPYLNARVLQDMVSEIEVHHTMMISPDLHLNGTNALYLDPIDNLPFCYGDQSFTRHIQFARQMHYNVKIYLSDHLKVDIDTIDDFRQHEDILQYHIQTQSEQFPELIQKTASSQVNEDGESISD